MKSVILEERPRDSLVNFVNLYNDHIRSIDIEETIQRLKDLIKFYGRSGYEYYPLEYLQNYWFDGLEKGNIQYDVYAAEEYFMEVWACWAVYSRKYLRDIQKEKLNLFPNFEEIKTIADLGNGIGISTAALTELFPHSTVIGTNFKESEQWKICELYANKYNFLLKEDTTQIGHIDIIFAFEYFEHIIDPISHVLEIIENNSPGYLILANSFGTVGIGHFKTYLCQGQEIDWKKISKEFNKVLKEQGYEKVKTPFFNQSPNVWKKSDNYPKQKELNEFFN